jgi:hypothetical protein
VHGSSSETERTRAVFELFKGEERASRDALNKTRESEREREGERARAREREKGRRHCSSISA